MKPYLRLLLPAGVLMLVIGTIAAGCKGDEELSLEEFFQEAQAIDDDFKQRVETLNDEFPGAGEADEEDLPAFKATLAQFPIVFGDFFDELQALNPPPEVEDAFEEFLNAGRNLVGVQQEYADRAEAAVSFVELEQIIGESGLEGEAIQDRYEAACLALQEIAESNDIVAHIGCAEAE